MSSPKRDFFINTYSLIPSRWRKTLFGIAFGMALSSILETGTMGVIALFISALNDPEIITKSSRLQPFVGFFPEGMLASQQSILYTLGLLACALMLLKNTFAATIAYGYSRFSAHLDAHFGGLLLSNFLRQDYEWHVSRHSADLVTTGTWRKFIVAVWYMGILAFNEILLVAMLGATLLYVAPGMSIAAFGILGGLSLCIYRLLRPRIDKLAALSARVERDINKDTSNITQGIKELIISSNQQYFYDQYQRSVVIATRAQAALPVLVRVPLWMFETAGFILLCGTVIATMYFASGTSTAVLSGQIALLAIVAWRVIPALNRIVSGFASIRDNMAKAQEVVNFIQHMPAAANSLGRHEPLPFRHTIEAKGLRFRYRQATADALHCVNFSIRSGETVGLVGRSGSGKSTLADLIIGLLLPTEGSIIIDGTPLTRETTPRWMAGVGYVGQNPFFTDGSIAENVAFGIPADAVDRDKLMQCCRMAALDDLIAQLPGGVDHPLGERAEKLSGGQRQRVAIARALYRSPQLLILDEATSALDQQSENTIKKTVHDLSGSLTMLIIAHRLSTVEHCDRVVWLDGGNVVMEGTPAEVLPHYKESLGAADA